MILGFKEHFDKAKTKPTFFREKILAGVGRVWGETAGEIVAYDPAGHTSGPMKPKLHTIREGHRWKKGDIMHMAYGVRTKNYQQFNKGIPELAVVKDVQDIMINWYNIEDPNRPGERALRPIIKIDGIELSQYLYPSIVANDGFDSVEDFFAWFDSDFSGQIIHFSDKIRY